MSKLYFFQKISKLNVIFLTLIICFFSSLNFFSQTVTITAPVASATYCAGTNVSVGYAISPTTFTTGNVFTIQLSDATGSFVSPTTIGTRTATNGNGGINYLIPYTTPSGSLYRIRVLSSAPGSTSQSNGVDLRINGLSIGTPTITQPSYCQGEIFNVTFSQSCNFSNLGFNNVYTVQLSDAAGSFASPIAIGTRTATTVGAISCTMAAVSAGTGYRLRIVSSNPAVISPDNGNNFTVNVSAGNPTVAGNGTWNAYCFNAANNYTLNYQGFFTENNLSIDTRLRYTSTTYPASANTVSGNAYAGCSFTNTNNYSVNLKRTNIPCGYYDFSIVGHDDEGRILIDGVQVYYNTYIGGGPVPNVYRGFITPTNTVEVRYSNTGSGPGFMAININTVNIINVFNPATICAGTTTSLTATNSTTVPLTFSWAPSAFASPTTGTATTVSPTITTIFTVSATDAMSGCSTSNTVQITVNPLPTTTISSITSTVICSPISSTTLTATGANTYTWLPAAGLNTTNGNVVIANPTATTVYTVSGSNNCSVTVSSSTINVQVIPSAPTPTVFGNNVWNVYCYDGRAFVSYYGYYTENNLSFNSQTRWGNTPSAANATSGLAYQGCNIPNNFHSTSHKRTNFTCGYYQIDIPAHDDDVTVLVDGNQVFQHIGCCDAHSGVWTGFLGASSTVEIRHQQGTGGTYVSANFIIIPYPVLGPPITICAGGPATITATPFISGATYSWTPNVGLSSTTGTAVVISPTANIVYTVTVSDPVTNCSASASQTVTVNPLPTTTVSPTTGTIACSSQAVTLNAGGANTYSWSPTTGLNATTGASVIATPTVTTVYTVTGNNVCADLAATATITVVPLISPTTYTNVWNVFCYNSTTFTNYFGYYTENGSGTSGYDFSTATRYSSVTPIPSNANATTGQAYLGCTMPATNYSMSFKRTGFTCGTYSVVSNGNDDNITMWIDGTQVATRGSSTASITLWVGVLNVNSQVEFRLNQGTGTSVLRVTFNTAVPTPSLSTWIGATNNDWFTASNWCGSGVPTASLDVLIPNSKPQNMPVINAPGAACRTLTIAAASAAAAPTSALPAASLTINAGNSLDVYGNWINNGVVIASSTSTVNLLGTTSSSLAGTATETLGSLVVNKTGTVTIPTSKVVQIASAGIFTSGIVNQSGTLRFLNSSIVSGASNTSYVNGQVIKVGTQAFDFPVGANNFYRPISISAPLVATDHFTAQYILTDASPSFTHTSKDATIDHIGRCEYWTLNRTGGSSNVTVTLSWNTTSCGVTNLSDLLVARWDAGQIKWKDEGNGGTTGNTTTGTIITSAPVTLFNPFTLASRTSANPLPIELVSFNCSNINKNTNGLSWVTASESNNDYFAIERSTNGINFERIAKQQGAGNSVTTLNYSYNDQNSVKGLLYYRLKQVDFGGKFTYSEICSTTNNGDGGVAFYPNPVKNTLTIDYEFTEKPKSNVISVTDVMGKLVLVTSSYTDSKVTLDCSNLSEGIYFLKVLIGDKEVVNKFTIQK